MSMMKTVLMCGCETGGGVWQEPKVVTPASSGVNAKIAMTRFESFMKSSFDLPAHDCSAGYVAGGSVSLVLSDVFGVFLADHGALGYSGERSAGPSTWASYANQDRKSTRLNSSHRCISYAVFC